VLEAVEDAFASAAKTGRHRMSINVLRELLTGDSTWSHFIPRILHEEDDHSMFKLSLSDILAVDVSNITDPNSRQACCCITNNKIAHTNSRLVALAAPFDPTNDGRQCRWNLNAVKAMQVLCLLLTCDAHDALQFFTVVKRRKETESDCKAYASH
jgi:hypothetical protein